MKAWEWYYFNIILGLFVLYTLDLPYMFCSSGFYARAYVITLSNVLKAAVIIFNSKGLQPKRLRVVDDLSMFWYGISWACYILLVGLCLVSHEYVFGVWGEAIKNLWDRYADFDHSFYWLHVIEAVASALVFVGWVVLTAWLALPDDPPPYVLPMRAPQAAQAQAG